MALGAPRERGAGVSKAPAKLEYQQGMDEIMCDVYRVCSVGALH